MIPLEISALYSAGLCCNFNLVLNNIYYYYGIRDMYVNWFIPETFDRNDFWGQDYHFTYGQPDDGNIWETLFEQLGPKHHYPNLSYNIFSANSHGVRFPFFGCCGAKPINSYPEDVIVLKDIWLKSVREKAKTAIKPKSIITDSIPKFSGKTVGIHYRHPGQRIEITSVKNHPGFEHYLELALEQKPDQIFIATDYQPAYEFFTEHGCHGQSHVLRANSDSGKKGDFGPYSTIGVENGKVYYAVDMMVDLYSLAACDIIVGVPSNVVVAALAVGNSEIKLV